MSDYLSYEEPATDGGYLGLDDPAPPTSAPAPPTPDQGGGYLSGGMGDGGDYLGGSDDGGYLSGGDDYSNQYEAQPQSSGGYFDDVPGAADDGYLSGGAPEQPSYAYPTVPAAQTMAPPAPAPMPGQQMQELSVQAPFLEDVRPTHVPAQQARENLSALVLDVEVPVEVYFGDASLTVEEFLEMGPGSVVELDHAIDSPIELRVRGKVIAHGQLVTINGNYGMRIVQMLEGHGR
jgi:flagellar motor switch protein FliN